MSNVRPSDPLPSLARLLAVIALGLYLGALGLTVLGFLA